jgi:RNA polymerase sigma factor (sigma-70 family)
MSVEPQSAPTKVEQAADDTAVGATIMHRNADHIKKKWLYLARRNAWTLIDDIDGWVCSVQDRYPDVQNEKHLEVMLLRAYSARLYQGCVDRETQALNEVRAYCLRLAKQQRYLSENIEDIVQETLFRMLVKLYQVREPESFLPWIVMTLRNVIRSLYTKQRESIPLDARDIATEQLIDPTQQPDEQAEQRDLHERLLLLIMQLGRPGRDVLLFSYMYEWDTEAIARKLGLQAAYVRVVRHRSLQQLRSMLRDEELDSEKRLA